MTENDSKVFKDPTAPVFLLTVDTEEEWNFTGGFLNPPFSKRNIDEVPAFQATCTDLGVKLTYFVDQAVAANTDNAQLLKAYFDNGECDFGAQLHPRFTPPVDESINERYPHAVSLPDELITRKIETLITQLQNTFGQHSYSYQAGRWSVKGELIAHTQ